MLSSQKPKLIPVAFATSGAKQDIPVASQVGVTPGRASYTDGFPPLTRTPLSAGGIPPYGTDFNGVLNEISAAIRWANAGMGYTYDAAFSTSVGGYPKGAQLTKSTNDGIWLNTVESNTANPDSGGTGWLDMTSGRLIGTPIVFESSGTYTPSAGVKSIRIKVWGGGGAGGGTQAVSSAQAAVGGGGSAGAYAESFIPATSIAIVIGTGGVANAGTDGTDGGASTAGSISASGGSGGALGIAGSEFPFGAQPRNPTTATGGNIINAPGNTAAMGFTWSNGGAIRAMGGQSTVGSSLYAATAAGKSAGGAGSVSAGSAGAQPALAGYNGAPGLVIVEEYS